MLSQNSVKNFHRPVAMYFPKMFPVVDSITLHNKGHNIICDLPSENQHSLHI